MLKTRLKESFGEVPEPLQNLINVGFAKNMAQALEVEHILINNMTCELIFNNADFIKNEKLMEAVSNYGKKATLINDVKPKIKFDFKLTANVDKLNALIEFLIEASE